MLEELVNQDYKMFVVYKNYTLAILTKINIGFVFFLIFIALAHSTSAQDTLRQRDAEEIKLLAQRKIEKGLNDLLNTLTFDELGEAERKAIIVNSYSTGSINRIFYDNKTIVEDDILPTHFSGQNAQDFPVDKYLANLDLFYVKTAERSIDFQNISVSNLKKSGYMYVKVFFTSLFRGKHTQAAESYRPTRRVAEVRAEKAGRKWLVSISRIAFWSERDSLNAIQNDITLMAADSSQLLSDEATRLEKLRNQEREQEQKALSTYNSWLTKGEKAFQKKDYEAAFEAYTQAEKLNQYDDLLPKRKLYQLKLAFEKARQTEADQLREYAISAQMARNQRDYANAIRYYHQILDKKPDSTALLAIIQELTVKANAKAEYDEKFAAGQYKELIKNYDRILKKDKANPDWYLGRGRCYAKLNDDDQALKDFNQSITLDYANLAALWQRAELYTRRKDYPKAIADYSTYLTINPKSADAYAQRAHLRTLTNNLRNASDDYDKAVLFGSNNAQHFLDRGIFRQQANAHQQAIDDFSQAVRLRPDDPYAYFRRGLSLANLKQFAEAGADFDRTKQLKLPVQQVTAIDSVGFRLYDLGVSLRERKQYTEAIEQLTNAIYTRKDFPLAYHERGVSYLAIKDYPKGIDDFVAATRYDSSRTDTYTYLGDAWAALATYDKAAEAYQKARKLASDNYPAYMGEGDALMRTGRFEDAIAALIRVKSAQRKIEKAYPKVFFRDMNFRLGRSQYEIHQYNQALESYEACLDIDPAYSDGYLNRARVYEALTKFQRAIDDYQRAIELNPGVASVYFAKGMALEKNKEYEKAVRTYSVVLNNKPRSLLADSTIARRGICLYQISKYADALQDLGQVAEQADTAICGYDCWQMAGIAAIYGGKADKGIDYLKKCLTSASYSGVAQYGIACAYLQKGNEAESLHWFEQAFKEQSLSAAFVRKDKLIDAIRKDFRKRKEFRQLQETYLK